MDQALFSAHYPDGVEGSGLGGWGNSGSTGKGGKKLLEKDEKLHFKDLGARKKVQCVGHLLGLDLRHPIGSPSTTKSDL